MNLKERGGGVYKMVWREERAGRNVIKLQPQKLKKIHPEYKIRIIKVKGSFLIVLFLPCELT